MRDHLRELSNLPWSDLHKVHARAAPVLQEVASNRKLLREMVEGIRCRDQLMQMSEQHYLLDYFVLHNAPEANFRLRLHMHTDNHKQRPHNHRFPFTTYIMCGSYIHYIHKLDRSVDGDTNLESMEIAYRTVEQAGSCYTISSRTVHTTYTEPNTVSLVVRGPAELERSIIVDRQSQVVTWRVSRENETPERRKNVQMTINAYEMLVGKLNTLGVI